MNTFWVPGKMDTVSMWNVHYFEVLSVVDCFNDRKIEIAGSTVHYEILSKMFYSRWTHQAW